MLLRSNATLSFNEMATSGKCQMSYTLYEHNGHGVYCLMLKPKVTGSIHGYTEKSCVSYGTCIKAVYCDNSPRALKWSSL